MMDEIKKTMEEQKEKDKSGLSSAISFILLDLAEHSPKAAEIILQDLKKEEMSLTKCARKLMEEAKKQAKPINGGSAHWMRDAEARQIIKGFYGLTDLEEQEQTKPKKKTFSLEDLL